MPQLLRFKTCLILFFGQVRPLGNFRILRLTFFDIAWNENTEINRVRYSNGSMANWSVRRGRPNPITDIRNAWEFIYINGELDSVRNTIGGARSGGLTLAIVLAMRALLTAGAVSYLFDHEWGLGKMMVPSGASGASSSNPYPRENLDINLPAAEEDGDQPDIQTTLHRLELAKISEQKDRLADRIRPLIESEKERLRKKFWHRQLTACPCVEYSVHFFIEG